MEKNIANEIIVERRFLIFGIWICTLNMIMDTFETNISTLSNEIQECGLDSDSFQVAVFIAGYNNKKNFVRNPNVKHVYHYY